MAEKEKLTTLERNWVLYDVGNSAFTLLVSTIIPIYFKNIASAADVAASDSTAYWSYALSVSTVIVAILGPTLGTFADNKDHKKPMFTFFLVLGVGGLVSLIFPSNWMTFLILFVIARVGYSMTLVFYDAMMVDVTTDERMDWVSSFGYAYGYIGSCVPFIGSLVLILGAGKIGLSTSAAMGIAFAINAAWWTLTTLPLLKTYKQKYYAETHTGVGETIGRLKHVLGELKDNAKARIFLIAFFFYIDGVYTIIDMSTSYGKDVGISDTQLLLALLFTQFVAFPCALMFGKLSRKYEADKIIPVCIFAYLCIALYALQLDTAWKFWFLATMVGIFQGAIQALSRSYFGKIIPKEKSSEYFGIYDIFGKGAAFMGTMLMGVASQIFNTSRAGVGLIAGMFALGLFLFVKQSKIKAE